VKGPVEVWRERWRRLAGREPASEVDDELDFHLEQRARELVAMGHDPREAHEQARRRFGDVEHIRGECKDIVQRRERRMARSEYTTDLLLDLRFTLRALRRRPGFTAVAVLTLALGIGANSAIWSVVDGVLLRPLPYREPARLVRVYDANPSRGVWNGKFSPLDLGDATAGLHRVESFGAFLYQPGQSGITLMAAGVPQRLVASYVGAGFFPTLGVGAALGRTLLPGENVPGRDRAVVMSDRLWRTRFGGDRGILGRTLDLDGDPFQVVGVMPSSFAFPAPEVDLWLPVSRIGEDDIPNRRNLRWLDVVARLAPGAAARAAESELSLRIAALAAAHPDSNEGWTRAVVEPLRDDLVGDVGPLLRVLVVAVGLVLLIACANLVNLLLARGTTRLQELAVRTALGAERRRLVRQLLTEGVVLSLLGGAVGLLLGLGGVRLQVSAAGGHLPLAGEIHADLRLLAFTFAVSLVAALIFGILPALRWSRLAGALALREGGRGALGGERERLRSGLVVVETGLAVLLLVGAGLLLHSLWRLSHVDAGFRPHGVLTLSLSLPPGLADDTFHDHFALVRESILRRVREVPGVVAAAASKTLPLHGQAEPYRFALPEHPDQLVEPAGGGFIVTSDYFRTLGIPVLRGREFRAGESIEHGDFDAVVNAALARQLWGTLDVTGKRLLFGSRPVEVVGVVGDVRTEGLGEPAKPALYVPSHLAPRASVKLFVRTEGDPSRYARTIADAIREVQPQVPVGDVEPLTAVVQDTLVRQRVFALLLGIFSMLALVLTVVGLYGVVAFAVAQRTREIAVRVALGAERGELLRMVLARVARLAGTGLLAGLLAALALARLLAGQLYGVTPRDPTTFVAVAVALGLAALVAAYVPVRRALSVAPASTLRGE
jgi:predicted permease